MPSSLRHNRKPPAPDNRYGHCLCPACHTKSAVTHDSINHRSVATPVFSIHERMSFSSAPFSLRPSFQFRAG